jgi:hypothetical protein
MESATREPESATREPESATRELMAGRARTARKQALADERARWSRAAAAHAHAAGDGHVRHSSLDWANVLLWVVVPVAWLLFLVAMAVVAWVVL